MDKESQERLRTGVGDGKGGGLENCRRQTARPRGRKRFLGRRRQSARDAREWGRENFDKERIKKATECPAKAFHKVHESEKGGGIRSLGRENRGRIKQPQVKIRPTTVVTFHKKKDRNT